MRVAIITARGGSKRIPRKNLKEFLGKPVISYAVDVAREAGLFDKVIVSTEDDEIARAAQQLGAEVPFRRPAELSDDASTTDDVLLHALHECMRLYGSVSEGCCIYPTSPFVTTDDLKLGLQMLLKYRATSAFPVVKYDFPIEQAFVLDGPRPRPRWPEKILSRSQDLEVCYHDAGLFYWFDAQKLLATRALYSDDAVAFPIPADRCQDINTIEDWHRAELKYRILTAASSS